MRKGPHEGRGRYRFPDMTATNSDPIRVELIKKEPTPKARPRDLIQLGLGVLIAAAIAWWVSAQTPENFATPTEYFTGLAGCGVFYAAFAAAARALQLVWTDAGFRVTERVMIAGGAFWTALIALTQISVFGVGS